LIPLVTKKIGIWKPNPMASTLSRSNRRGSQRFLQPAVFSRQHHGGHGHRPNLSSPASRRIGSRVSIDGLNWQGAL
jgi:hypothetical protein